VFCIAFFSKSWAIFRALFPVPTITVLIVHFLVLKLYLTCDAIIDLNMRVIENNNPNKTSKE
jgi:hypothetical protein